MHQEPPLDIIVGGALYVKLYRALRGASTALILALVPDSNREGMLEAFDAGVDDCQATPISHTEIVARVNVMLRHPKRPVPTGVASAGDPDSFGSLYTESPSHPHQIFTNGCYAGLVVSLGANSAKESIHGSFQTQISPPPWDDRSRYCPPR
ncbi:MAG: hypothetical protein M1132_06900, partial [Chloroflexi bacterium]|nr:hypothetical protein [Chloroflexota bacterium]